VLCGGVGLLQSKNANELGPICSQELMGHSGTFSIEVKLTDKTPTAESGPFTVTNSGQTLTGTYTKSGSTISFADKAHTVNASIDSGSVILQVQGYPKGRIVA
jgi:hypothetical protein